MADLAVYTTIYPGVEAYLGDWFRSVESQTDREFDLWIGVNGMDVSRAAHLVPGAARLRTTWVAGAAADRPAVTRQEALSRIIDAYDVVVLVDSDDVLHDSRVAAARALVATCDLAGCALRIVDAAGRDLGVTFGLEPEAVAADILPRQNVFGLSNSVYRSSVLRRCLPLPTDTLLIDWFLATRAWLLGARLDFDRSVQMDYRQHGRNTARVLGPFGALQVEQDTRRVAAHFRLVTRAPTEDCLPERLALVRDVAEDVDRFWRRVVQTPRALDSYVVRLNALHLPPRWWSWVAHPALSEMWA